MNSGLQHVGQAIPAAVAALKAPPSLDQLCAALDPTNPYALDHWEHRIRAMRRWRGADEALRFFLYEIDSRRTATGARAKSFSGPILKPAAWLNAQTLKWIDAQKSKHLNKRSFSP